MEEKLKSQTEQDHKSELGKVTDAVSDKYSMTVIDNERPSKGFFYKIP